jgi:hypothetical protein
MKKISGALMSRWRFIKNAVWTNFREVLSMRKNLRWTAIAVLVFFLPQTAFAGNVPYVPAMFASVIATIVPAVESPNVIYASQLSHSPNNLRGNIAENLMRGYFSGGGDLSSNKSWYSLDPGAIHTGKGGTMSLLAPSKTGRAGFDGLFMQFDNKGNPSSLMVAESKYGHSPLGQTKHDGKQMGEQWIRRRADMAAKHYRRMAGLARNGRILQSGNPPKIFNGKITNIPVTNKQSAWIWWDSEAKSYVYYSEKPVDIKILTKQLAKTSQYAGGVADGKIKPRRVLWRMKIDEKGSIAVTAQQLDTKGNAVKGAEQVIKSLSKPYLQLSGPDKKRLEDALFEALKKQYGHLGSDRAAEQASRDLARAKQRDKGVEDLIDRVNLKNQHWSWSLSGKIALKSGLLGAGIALLFHVVPLAFGGSFDGNRMVKDMGLSFAGAGGGALAGLGSAYAIEKMLEKGLASSSQGLILKMIPDGLKNTGALSRLLGGTVGGLVAIAIYSYGYALLNGGDWSTGNRLMLTGATTAAVSVAAGYVILQTAMLVGTASTGTAIASLSGAVATKAALAWLGGGALSAGGFGTAGGAVVLSGGAMLVVIGAGFLISYGWSALDEGKRMERLESLLNAYHI